MEDQDSNEKLFVDHRKSRFGPESRNETFGSRWSFDGGAPSTQFASCFLAQGSRHCRLTFYLVQSIPDSSLPLNRWAIRSGSPALPSLPRDFGHKHWRLGHERPELDGDAAVAQPARRIRGAPPEFATDAQATSNPRKICDREQTVYTTRSFKAPAPALSNRPVRRQVQLNRLSAQAWLTTIFLGGATSALLKPLLLTRSRSSPGTR